MPGPETNMMVHHGIFGMGAPDAICIAGNPIGIS